MNKIERLPSKRVELFEIAEVGWTSRNFNCYITPTPDNRIIFYTDIGYCKCECGAQFDSGCECQDESTYISEAPITSLEDFFCL